MKSITKAAYLFLATTVLATAMPSTKLVDTSNNINNKLIISRAETELEQKGITSEQAQAHSLLSERAYNAVRPSLYNQSNKTLELALEFAKGSNRFDIEALKKEYSKQTALLIQCDKKGDYKQIEKQLKVIQDLDQKISDYSGHDDVYSEDAWKMYLGLPQTNKTFSISKYAPSKSKGNTKYYYSLPKEFEDELLSIVKENKIPLNKINEFSFKNIYSETESRARVLGNFKVDKGQDKKGTFISYYDKYDLSPKVPIVGKIDLEDVIGKPFEIYNRIYFTPSTMQRI